MNSGAPVDRPARLAGSGSGVRPLCTTAEHGLSATPVAPPRRPWPAPPLVGPNKLQCRDSGPEEVDGKPQVHIGVFHLDDLSEEPILVVDVHAPDRHVMSPPQSNGRA